MTSVTPTHRCRVINPEDAATEVRTLLEGLAEQGERPWCEVLYPAPPHRDPDEWETEQADTFDAVELIDGELVTLLPYALLKAASA